MGCGNPIGLAEIKEGEVVLDLGSGGGLDCFLAAQKVGNKGKVIGLDMTPEMINQARENAGEMGVDNVEFRQGEMENMPVESRSIDVIISNCVINLSPDKDAVFKESYRVLKPGGKASADLFVRTPFTLMKMGGLSLSVEAHAVDGKNNRGVIEKRLKLVGPFK